MQTTFSVNEKEHLGGIRKVYLLKSDAGAIEMWRLTKMGSRTEGGLKIHSLTPFDFAPDKVADHQDCAILDDRPCWTHSSLSTYLEFVAWNDFDDHQDVKRELTLWHKQNFEKE